LAEFANPLHLEMWQQKNLRPQLLKAQSIISIFELGTGAKKFSLAHSSNLSCFSWSLDGKYLYSGSTENKQMRVFQVDRESQENMWTVIDATKSDPNFWNKYPINLNQSPIQQNMQSRSEQASVQLQYFGQPVPIVQDMNQSLNPRAEKPDFISFAASSRPAIPMELGQTSSATRP